MIGKKSKIIFIALIFMIVFNFSYPIVYASGDVAIPSTQEQASTQEQSSSQAGGSGKTNSTLGTIVDHGLRFIN